RPLDDVDLLAAQLPADDLDAGAAQPHAGADGIDVALGGRDRHLGPLARLPRRRLHDDDAFLDLRDLGLEQPCEIAGVGPRQRDLGALGRAAHLEDEGADAVAGIIALARDLLALGQDRLGLADLEDHVALLDAVHDAPQDLSFLPGELRVDALALGVADLLEDHLLGGLGRDATKVLGRALLLQLELVVELRLRIQSLGLVEADLELGISDLGDDLAAGVGAHLAGLAVDLNAHVVARQGLPRGRQQGRLQRLEEDLFVDPLLAAQLLDDHDQFAVHNPAGRRGQGTSTSSRAFVTRARGNSTRSPPSSSVSRASSTSTRRPWCSSPPASQQRTRLPTAQRSSRSFRSWRSSPGDDTSRSYASSIRPAASRTSPISRLARRQSSIPTPPGLSTNTLRIA